MKSCPTCNRTFDDTFTFCLIDGAILSAPFDSQATVRIPEVRVTNPPPTEVLSSAPEVIDPNLSATVASPLPQPTQPFIVPQFAPLRNDPVLVEKVKPVEIPLGRILLGIGIGMLVGLLISMFFKDPKGAVPLAIFFGLVGAVVGRFASSQVRINKRRLRD